MFETIGGIPLHPLVVHAAVVLVPLASLLVIAYAVSARFRSWSALLVPLAATVAFVTVPLATQSGESLEHSVTRTELINAHTEMGEGAIPFAIGLVVLAWGMWWFHRTDRRDVLTKVAAGLAIVAALGCIVQIVRIGHSGAEAVWTGVVSSASP